jgi:hypothetical protein
MKINDPVVLKRIEEIEAAAAGLRMAAGFPELHATTSRREGTKAITLDAARALVEREWANYPDLSVLRDELTDRGLSCAEADLVLRETLELTPTEGGA